MSDVVRKLAPVKLAPDAEMVDMLENLTARVKAGEFVAFGFAAECAGGGIESGFTVTKHCEFARTIGAVEWLRHRLMKAWTKDDP